MILENLLAAINAVLELQTLFFMIVGVTAGLIAGAIPGFTITISAPSSKSRVTSLMASRRFEISI